MRFYATELKGSFPATGRAGRKINCPVRTVCAVLWLFLSWRLGVCGDLQGGSFQFREVARVPASSEQLVCLAPAGRPVFYVAEGKEILFAEEDQRAMTFSSLPAEVTQICAAGTPLYKGLFALTADGTGYMFSPSGEKTVLIRKGDIHARRIAFTSLPLYYRKPYALATAGGRQYFFRLAPEKEGENAFLSVEKRLSTCSRQVSSLRFCEIPGNWGLLALSERGELWRVYSDGGSVGCVKRDGFKGGGYLAVDDFGFWGRSVLISIPKNGELWAFSGGKNLRWIAKGLNQLAGDSSYQGAIATGPKGSLYILAGKRIISMEPKENSPLAGSAEKMAEAEEQFRKGKWKQAEKLAQEAAAASRRPRAWVDHVKRFRLACKGASQLKQAKKLAKKRGYGRLVKISRQLEKRYSGTRIQPELLYFRKKCENKANTLILTGFEDKQVVSKGIAPTIAESTGSFIRRAAAPEPVKEGRYSLKWEIDRRNDETPTLVFAGNGWGHGDSFVNASFWVYSERNRFRLVVSFISGTNEELAVYPVRLSKGWQKLTKPPIGRREQRLILHDPTLSKIVLETTSQGPNSIYIDDLRLNGTVRR